MRALVEGTVRRRDAAAPGPVRWLGLAAAPTFAAMALLSASGGADTLCTAMHGGLSGMTPMYALMSVFHAAPWLKLIVPSPH